MLGNNKSSKTLESGSARLKIFDGVERIPSDVRHVTELKRNLISLGTLDKFGYCRASVVM